MRYTFLLSVAMCCATCITKTCQCEDDDSAAARAPAWVLQQRIDNILEQKAFDEAEAREALEAPYMQLYEMRKSQRGLRKSDCKREQNRQLRQANYRKALAFKKELEDTHHNSQCILRITQQCVSQVISAINQNLTDQGAQFKLKYALGVTYWLRNGDKKTVWKTSGT